jgi:hypothetical protein
MLMLRDIYDTAIIVSGDQDYVPAAQVLKDAGTRHARCSCGQLEAETTAEPLRVSVCHCHGKITRGGRDPGRRVRRPRVSGAAILILRVEAPPLGGVAAGNHLR